MLKYTCFLSILTLTAVLFYQFLTALWWDSSPFSATFSGIHIMQFFITPDVTFRREFYVYPCEIETFSRRSYPIGTILRYFADFLASRPPRLDLCTLLFVTSFAEINECIQEVNQNVLKHFEKWTFNLDCKSLSSWHSVIYINISIMQVKLKKSFKIQFVI